ncbi:MAG: hypothetical protein WBA31_05465 [Candidatus Dormiibacterota bacterium]
MALLLLGVIYPQAGPSVARSATVVLGPSAPSATPPSSFVALTQAPSYQRRLQRFSTATGQALDTISGTPTGMQVEGIVLTRSGVIWVTTAEGPRFRNDTAGGDPAPDSCRSSIIQVRPNQDRAAVQATFPRSQLVSDAVPNPSGSRLAYLESGCRDSFADSHIVVRDLDGRHLLTIGADTRACHVISPPSWSLDGQQLTFTYSPAAAGDGSRPGVCPAWGPGELAVASSRHFSGIGQVRLQAAPHGCGYTRSVFDAWGIAAVETCGANGLGPTHLVQLSPTLAVMSSLELQPGSDGTSLSASGDGEFVLVDEYQAPRASGPNSETGPWDWLYVFDGTSLRVIHVYPDDQYGVSNASW